MRFGRPRQSNEMRRNTLKNSYSDQRRVLVDCYQMSNCYQRNESSLMTKAEKWRDAAMDAYRDEEKKAMEAAAAARAAKADHNNSNQTEHLEALNTAVKNAREAYIELQLADNTLYNINYPTEHYNDTITQLFKNMNNEIIKHTIIAINKHDDDYLKQDKTSLMRSAWLQAMKSDSETGEAWRREMGASERRRTQRGWGWRSGDTRKARRTRRTRRVSHPSSGGHSRRRRQRRRRRKWRRQRRTTRSGRRRLNVRMFVSVRRALSR